MKRIKEYLLLKYRLLLIIGAIGVIFFAASFAAIPTTAALTEAAAATATPASPTVTPTIVSQAPAEEETLPQGLRPDAPPYAVHGPYAVGMRDFVIEEGDQPGSTTVWSPSPNPSQSP